MSYRFTIADESIYDSTGQFMIFHHNCGNFPEMRELTSLSVNNLKITFFRKERHIPGRHLTF